MKDYSDKILVWCDLTFEEMRTLICYDSTNLIGTKTADQFRGMIRRGYEAKECWRDDDGRFKVGDTQTLRHLVFNKSKDLQKLIKQCEWHRRLAKLCHEPPAYVRAKFPKLTKEEILTKKPGRSTDLFK